MTTQLDYEDYLQHYGVPGMKWGERKAAYQGKRDAKKSARAKAAYGEGSGNRRKAIKEKVDARSSNPSYKKAFDKTLAKQDPEKLAKRADQERKAKDTAAVAEKKIRDRAFHLVTGGAAIAVTSGAVYAASKNPKIQARARKAAEGTKSKAINVARAASLIVYILQGAPVD